MIKKAEESRYHDKPFPDRIYRGRILRLARESSNGFPVNAIGGKIDPAFHRARDAAWLADMIARLQKDGLVVVQRNRLRLP